MILTASSSLNSEIVCNIDDDWPNVIEPMSVSRYESVESNANLYNEELISSVCRHTPVAGSQILTAPSCEAEARRRESCEKATDVTQPPWPSSVCRHTPVAGSQILTAPSREAEARRRESCEKAIDVTQSA